MHNKILNFRDLGGIRVEGGVVKPHKLLRGGPLEKLEADTVDILLNQYELKKVLDLRTVSELKRQPNMIFDGVEYVHLDIISGGQELTADPTQMNKTNDRHGGKSSMEYMSLLNDKFIRDEISREEYRKFFQELLKTDSGANYFHCSAGKDRTGFAAAQILKILGASQEDIMKDYLRTNDLNHANRKWMTDKYISENPEATQAMIDDYQGFLTVHENYINTAFKAIEEDYGNFNNYVTEVLQLNEADIRKLRDLYIQFD